MRTIIVSFVYSTFESYYLLAMVAHFCCIVISGLVKKAPKIGTSVVLT